MQSFAEIVNSHCTCCPNLQIVALDTFLFFWDREYGFALPPFSLIGWVLRKIIEEKIDYLIIVTHTWQTQPWYAQLLKMSVQPAFFLLHVKYLLGKNHPLVKTSSLGQAVWKVSRKVYKWKEFQATLPSLSHIKGEKAQQRIENRPRVSGLAGVMEDKLILFKHVWTTLLISCLENLIKGYSIEPWIL